MRDQGIRLGAHMSIEGGLSRAVDRALDVEATALQIFVKSSRQWEAPPLEFDAVALFRSRAVEAGLERHTLAHASYLINIAAPDPALRRRSERALRDELARCSRLGVPYLVLHPGSHTGSGEAAGLERVVRTLDRIFRPRAGARSPSYAGVTLLLETTAGQGSNLGASFAQLGEIIARARFADRLGVCFDTCHVLAAGYELRDGRGYRATMRAFDEAVGLDRLLAFHLNDSRYPRGSRRDRHEHIGRGELGVEPFRLLLADRRFRGLPMVLETPKGKQLDEDRENLALLRSLVPGSAR
jgi:deoxyribonuclease-4